MCTNFNHDHDHHHDHNHDHHHDHNHDLNQKSINLELDLLSDNNRMAQRVRGFLDAKNILAINLMSSPGAGKTTLLEATINLIRDKACVCVIEGDQQTSNDALRISKLGAKAIQINTGGGCHLEADMVYRALLKLDPPANSILFIENVGNLVCPALFDLGEAIKVVVISLPEGDDKPLKYPAMFSESQICIINKTDLAPYISASLAKLRDNLFSTNHHLTLFETSATSGLGMEHWCDFLIQQLQTPRFNPNSPCSDGVSFVMMPETEFTNV